MTSPQSVKKLTELFEQSAKTAGSGQPTGAAAKPIALPGLATGSVTKTRDQFQEAERRKQVTETERRKQVIAMHLIRTGRANVRGATKGYGKHNLGGKRSADADARAEKGAGKVLADMESATQGNQRTANPSGPLAHAVSGHGKGTDQTARLMHGRRNDELLADKAAGTAPATSVPLGAGPNAPSTPEYTTVGSDPSNISGRFGSHQAMLHAVTEGFARASMTEHLLPPGAEPDRMVTAVSGRGGEDSGESFTLPAGFAKQDEGAPVTPDEMRQRNAAITTSGVQNSRLVLDPVKGASGRRAGWALQTAFPVGDAADAEWETPRDQVAMAKVLKVKDDFKRAKKKLEECTATAEQAAKDVTKQDSAIKAKQAALSKVKAPAGKIKLQEQIDELEPKRDQAKLDQQKADAAQLQAKQEYDDAESAVAAL